jgi:membrane associated rhomboid family serine protease
MFVHVPSRRPPPPPWATPLLAASWVAIFVWLTTASAAARASILRNWGTVPEGLFASPSAWWAPLLDERAPTLLTAIFIHADWLHLTGNVAFLLIFGLSAERTLGTLRFLVLLLLAGVASNLAAAVSLAGSVDSVVVGASGAISAVIGAYLVLFPNARLGVVLPLGLYLEFVRTPAALLIGIWAGLQVLLSFVGPSFGAVAWWAHIAGFLGGILFALLSRPAITRRLRQRQR